MIDPAVGLLVRGRHARLAPLAAGLPLAALALLVRALPFPAVFAPTGVHPSTPDAYYHLRRIAYTVVGFPRFLDFDPYLAFPDGGRPIWPPLFDFTLAALARLWLGPQSGPPLERLLMWAPPLLGAACVLALFLIARRVWGRLTAWLAALLLALLPAHFMYSRLGELDHHAAVALAVTLVFGAALTRIRLRDEPSGSLLAGALPLGAAQAFALLLWPGCLLAVLAADAALLVCILTREQREPAAALARRCALVHALALLIVAPFSWGNVWERWGSFSPVVLSRFQPLLLAAGAIGFGLLGEGFQRVRFPATFARRALAALAVGGAVLALLAATAPAIVSGAGDAWGWLAKREDFQARVAESQPMLRLGADFDPEILQRVFTRLAIATPALLLALALGARGRQDAAERLFLAGWTAVWLAAALVQQRFVNELSVPYALLIAVCAADLARAAGRRLPSRALRVAGALAGLAAAAWLLAPIQAFHAPYLANVRRALRGEPARLSGWQPEQRALTRVGHWLAEHTPPTAGYWDASQRPEYGVLAAWGDGHQLRYVAERPMVQDNFGDDVSQRSFALAESYFAAPGETEALRIAEQLRARYVLVRGGGSGHSQGYPPGSLFARLHRLRGAEASVSAASDAAHRIPALAHHRLLFDAEIRWGASHGLRPQYKIFEIVAGARIAGRAAPGAPVRAELPIRLGRSGGMVFSGEAEAGPDGAWQVVVPYANDGEGHREIRPAGAYRVRSGGREVRVSVTDTQVREGARVEAPPLFD